ncbi:MAG: Ig-like domain-containing protein, partial [Paludibacteraceae bacterium]|nr:Ig-like domain-containing protein [Paludibacteraceae bacterium]
MSGNSSYYELALTFPAVEPTDITLDETAITLLGTRATKQLTATIEPDNATEKSVTWKSDDTTVATVDDEGLVSAVGGGTTTITATTANGLTATCSVTVDASVKNNDATLSSLTVSAGTLTPAFDAETEAYTVSLPYGSSIPTVGATKNDDYASDPVIIQATAFTAGNNVASVSVTAEDEETTKTYTVTFTMAEPDLRLYEVVLTNDFSAFIDNNYNADDNYSVTGYYFSGEDAPTIKSFTAATNGATATISGDKLIVSIDSYSLEFDLILTAVNPLTEEDEVTFDGTEGYVKGGVAGTHYT